MLAAEPSALPSQTFPLWPDKPPRFTENAPPEQTSPEGKITRISIPSITVYLPAREKNTGLALIMCPGGGYGSMGWPNHVIDAAAYFIPRGIAVIGLKYRTSPPNKITPEDRSIPLLDVQRAVRTVRLHANEWHIRQIGVVGFSAGANLAITLAGNFDAGDPASPDPVEKKSCRPDFIVGSSTWHWRKKTSPFTSRKDTPPVFLVHATNDGIKGGGAPIELPYAIKAQLDALGVPVQMDIYDQGAHGVGNLIPQRVAHGYPPTKWPEHLQAWLATLKSRN